jgi:hypothetical protein
LSWTLLAVAGALAAQRYAAVPRAREAVSV